jgi:uncharacterized protein (TIGR02147 family)
MEKQSTVQLPIIDILKTELAKRCQKNPSYSLRSFAKSLELSPAFISKLLNGDRPFTAKTIDLLAEKLPLNPKQVSFYKSRLKNKKQALEAKEIGYRQIGLDQFQLISDWYHFAIMELVTVEHFNPAPAWIAKELGISVHQATDGMERLLRLGYLKKGSKGQILLVEKNNTIIGPEIAGPATQNQQVQILELAIQALTETPIRNRSQTASTMAIPSDRLDEAKEIITDFRRRLASLMQRPGKRDSVYQLSVSFFPLTKNKPQEKQK